MSNLKTPIVILLLTLLSLNAMAASTVSANLACSKLNHESSYTDVCATSQITREELILMIKTGQDISGVNTSGITDMSGLFKNNPSFNQDIGNWDVSNVFSMTEMFSGATAFNKDIGWWNVSKVVNMDFFLKDATSFNQELGNWDVSSVFSMTGMFSRATSFNKDIGHWDVSSVSNMNKMFNQATSFNQNISGWNVAYVDYMAGMFNGAASFAQDLSAWRVSQVSGSLGFRDNSGLTCGQTPLLPVIFTGCMGSLEVQNVHSVSTLSPTYPQIPAVASKPTRPQVSLSGFGNAAPAPEERNGYLLSAITSLRDVFSSNKSVKDVAKEKVSNYAENKINATANEVVNAYTPGKTKISITGIQNRNPKISLKTIQPLSALDESSRDLTFAQGSIATNTGITGDRTTINIGIGKRYLSKDDQAIAGANVFFDQELDTNHKRASIGLEYKRSNFDATYNKYIPISSEQAVGIYREEVLSGQELRLSGQMPYMPWAKVKYNAYSWNSDSGETESGNKLGVNVKLTQNTEIAINKNFSKTSENKLSAEFSVTLPLSQDEKMTRFSFDSSAFRPSQKMSLTDLDMVEREDEIKVKRTLDGSTVVLGVFNATTVGSSCTIKNDSGTPLKDIYGNVASGTTDSTGSITLQNIVIPTGIVVVECIGGTYSDESRATSAPALSAPNLHVSRSISTSNTDLEMYATPISEIAYRRANSDGNLSDIDAKVTEIATIFGLQGVDMTSTKPEDLNNQSPTNTDNGKYGLVLAAVSQLANESLYTPEEIIEQLTLTINTTGDLPRNEITNAVRRLSSGGIGAGARIDLNSLALEKLQTSKQPLREILISESSVSLTEGTESSYDIALSTKPESGVSINIIASNANLTISPATITFSTDNWWQKQLVLITPKQDDNTTSETDTITHTLTSVAYGEVLANSIAVNISDDDTPGVFVLPNPGVGTTIESSTSPTTATLAVKLNNQPSADVIITLALNNQRVSLDLSELTFTKDNWSEIQNVIVSPVNDSIKNATNITEISLVVASGSDADYMGVSMNSILITTTDDDSAGIIVSQTSSSTTTEVALSEPLSEATFTIKLNSQPVSVVNIPLLSTDTSEGVLDKNTLQFTSENWMTEQIVTVFGQNDNKDDGDKNYDILILDAVSDDNNYNADYAQTLQFTNTDNDTASVDISVATMSLDEGSVQTINMKLTTIPNGYVIIPIALDAMGQQLANLDKTSLIFDQNNWNIDQVITITSINDNIDFGNVSSYSIITSVAETAGSDTSVYKYAGVNPADIAVNPVDNDSADLTQTMSLVNISESNLAPVNYAISISTSPQPGKTVIVNLSQPDSTEFTVSPTSIEFNDSNWSIAQNIAITPVDDNIYDNTQTNEITATITGTDPQYASKSLPVVQVVSVDDDFVGVVVSSVDGSVSESGSTGVFDVYLTSQPTGTVKFLLDVYSDSTALTTDSSEATLSTSSLLFTTSAWSSANKQTVTITGISDDIADGDQQFWIKLSVDTTYSSTDYDSQQDVIFSDINVDADQVGVIVMKDASTSLPAALQTSEAPLSDNFVIKLGSKPQTGKTVRIDFSTDDTTEGLTTPSSIVFDDSNWNAYQVITVVGQADSVEDIDVSYNVIIAIDTADANHDTNYNMSIPSIPAINTNTDFSTVSIASIVVDESVGTGSMAISLSSPSESDITVNYTFSDGTAISASDYTATSGALVITAGLTSGQISFTVLDDALDENDEVINVNITSLATISQATATITITDNDIQPTVAFQTTATAATEGGIVSQNLTVNLDAPSGKSITVNMSLAGDATPGDDYVNPTTTLLTFAPGEITKVFTIDIIDDSDIEIAETILVTMDGQTNATLGTSLHTITITSDE